MRIRFWPVRQDTFFPHLKRKCDVLTDGPERRERRSAGCHFLVLQSVPECLPNRTLSRIFCEYATRGTRLL